MANFPTKQELENQDALHLIGILIKHDKQKRANITMAIFVVLSLLVAIAGVLLFLFYEELDAVICYSLSGGGLLVFIITLCIYGGCRKHLKKKQTIIFGQSHYDAYIEYTEHQVKHYNHKKHGDRDPFKHMKSINKIVFLSKHLKQAEPITAPNVTGLVYDITLIDKSVYLIVTLKKHTFEEFILDNYINRFVKTKR